MTDSDSSSDSDNVGYRKPPAAHRFKKGASGNPKGRPRKSKRTEPALSASTFNGETQLRPEEKSKTFIIEEAYRLVTVRDGDRVERIPVVQAILRSVTVAAMKGSVRAQQIFVDLLRIAEEQRNAAAHEMLKAAVEYKEKWEAHFEECARTGRTPFEPLPHPDDVKIDMIAGEVRIEGPVLLEQKQSLDALRNMTPDIMREYFEIEYALESKPKDPDLLRRRKELAPIVEHLKDDAFKRLVREHKRLPKRKASI